MNESNYYKSELIHIRRDDDMDKEWIYIKEDDNKVRYVLGYKGNKTLICLGINPSTAEPNKLDNTLKSVERIAINNGYDSFIMLNVYPVRQTIFQELEQKAQEIFFKRNLKEIENIIASMSGVIDVWIAFGNLIEDRDYLMKSWEEIDKILKKYNVTYYCAGINNTGMPKHPLYLKSNTKLQKL